MTRPTGARGMPGGWRRLTIVAGAMGSVWLMLLMGRNTPRVLLLMFVGWVLAPFLVMPFVERRATTRSHAARTVFDALLVIITIGSLAAYGTVAAVAPRIRPAPVFLLVPLASLAALAAALVFSPRGRDGTSGAV